jgi:hypothetical protein
MDREIVGRLHTSFEDMVQIFPETDTEYWFARDLQLLLGYTQWRNFEAVIDKAIQACTNSGHVHKTILRISAKWSLLAPAPSEKSMI